MTDEQAKMISIRVYDHDRKNIEVIDSYLVSNGSNKSNAVRFALNYVAQGLKREEIKVERKKAQGDEGLLA